MHSFFPEDVQTPGQLRSPNGKLGHMCYNWQDSYLKIRASRLEYESGEIERLEFFINNAL